MDLEIGNGTTVSLSISKTPTLPSRKSTQLIASARIKAAEDKVRRLEAELADAKEDEAQFTVQQNLDIAVQALNDLNFDKSNDDDEVLLPAEQMKRFEKKKLKAAEEDSLLDGMKSLGLRKQKGVGGISKKQRYDPKKGPQFMKEAKEGIKSAIYEAAAAGLEGEGKKAGEIHLSAVGILMGKKTAPRLSRWRKGSL